MEHPNGGLHAGSGFDGMGVLLERILIRASHGPEAPEAPIA